MRHGVNSSFFHLCPHQILPHVLSLGTRPELICCSVFKGESELGELADSQSCPGALCSHAPFPLFSCSEAAPPGWHTTVPGTLQQHIWDPSSFMWPRKLYTIWPLLLFSITTPSLSLLKPHWPFLYSLKQTKPTPIGGLLHLLLPLSEMLFL